MTEPGIFKEFNDRSWRIPERYLANRYRLALHGVGMVDEWPSVPMHPDFAHAYGGHSEESMVICVDSLIGEENRPDCVKLETQVPLTAKGAERLDGFPWEAA
jgi:hypothetical protein